MNSWGTDAFRLIPDKIPILVSKSPDLYAFFITLPAYCKL
jgi:hypothetical protein